MATNNAINGKNTGLQALTSAGVLQGRTVTGTSAQVAVTNGNGTAGNPTLAFPSIIQLSTQPAFFARVSGNPASVTGDGTAYTVIYDTQVFQQGANYSTSTGIFTAPVTGIYQFIVVVGVQGITALHTQCNITISNNTSGATYIVRAGALFPIINADGINGIQNQIIMNLTAADQVATILTVSGSTKTINVFGSNNSSWFAGSLLF